MSMISNVKHFLQVIKYYILEIIINVLEVVVTTLNDIVTCILRYVILFFCPIHANHIQKTIITLVV